MHWVDVHGLAVIVHLITIMMMIGLRRAVRARYPNVGKVELVLGAMQVAQQHHSYASNIKL